MRRSLRSRHILSCLAAVIFGVGTASAEEMRELVLATSERSQVPPLSSQEIRKLYLGVPVDKGGVTVEPLLNVSDDVLFEVFLQKVTYMSADTYEKQVASIVFRLGGQRPEAFRDPAALIAALQENERAVTFIWAKDLNQHPGLKPIGKLWTGVID